MSNIESTSKYFTAALIAGHSAVFTPYWQLRTASLFSLIAARLEFTTEQQAISGEDRDWLRYYREPSKHWKVWIARFADINPDAHWSRTYGIHLESAPTEESIIEYCKVRVSTFVMGQLCAHVFYSTDADLTSHIHYDGIDLCRIWPPSQFDVEMIRLPALDGNGVLSLHETFARQQKPSAKR